jgi:cytochrome d ubiquinol oxidase subunit II
MPWDDVTFDLTFVHGVILLAGVTLYAVLGGADFGGGVWDMLASGPRAEEQRKEIARAIGPIWEANHVWLIFVIVLTFSIYPPVFSAVSSALYIPLSLVLVGITLRGGAFVFRAYASDVVPAREALSRVFAGASVVTPLLLGMCAGAVASGDIRVIDGDVTSSLWSPWLSPFAIVVGLLALTVCAYLAAVYLCVETTGDLREDFRRRALVTGAVFTALSAIILPLTRTEAPVIWDGMLDREIVTVVPLAVLAAVASGLAVLTRRFRVARLAAVAWVAIIIGGWALAQYPYLVVPDLTVTNAAASRAMMRVALWTYVVGAILLIPALWLLFALFKGKNPATTGAYGASTGELHPADERAT